MKKFFTSIAMIMVFSSLQAQEGMRDASQSIEVTEGMKRDFENKVQEKVANLSNYISVIGSKTRSANEKDECIEATMELFRDERCKMQVSSVNNRSVKSYPMRTYLNRLRLLNYRSVDIQWFDVCLISNLVKTQTPNLYEGVVSLMQRFDAVRGDGGRYQDVTKKNIKVYVKLDQTMIAGQMRKTWSVKLGDILVKETKSSYN